LQGVKSGTRFANTFSKTPGFIVCGYNGTTVVADCEPGTAYNATVRACVATPNAIAALNYCANATDGVYTRKNSTDGYEVSSNNCGHCKEALAGKPHHRTFPRDQHHKHKLNPFWGIGFYKKASAVGWCGVHTRLIKNAILIT
jgi:hypothetical protein